jgi:hypothetical protein
MGLFNRKKKNIEETDLRTNLEKKFEDAGQVTGKKTGEFVQSSINKIEQVKTKVKADEKIGGAVGKASKSTKETYGKVRQKVNKQ